MKFELRASSPLWLEHSGLPQLLADKTRGPAAWLAFKKIAELDCERNPEPGIVETSVAEIAGVTGVAPGGLRKALGSLRKLKLVACFLPDGDEEPCMLRIRVPLATPLSVEEIKRALPRVFAEQTQHFRYAEDWEPTADEVNAADPELQEIVDLYFNAVGLKMNAFILDELRLVRARFAMDAVRRMFRRAQQNEIHSLQWVVRELLRAKRKYDEENPKAP
jgi:hypothetical protein